MEADQSVLKRPGTERKEANMWNGWTAIKK